MKPLHTIDRLWLRRIIIGLVILPALFLYLGTGAMHWGRDFYKAWRQS